MAVDLGEVFATARLDTKKLHSDVGDAEGKIHKLASGMGTALKAGAIVAGAAFAALGAAIYKTVEDLGRIETIGAQTEAVIESTGGAANVTREHIDELAGELERLTSVEAESITEGQNMLLTFTNISNQVGEGNDIFDRATKTVLDMSVALGQDMQQTSIQVGKALNDPIQGVTALRRVGVQLSEQQQKQVDDFMAVNDIAGAQKVILEELNKEFGGSAEALGKTLPGQIQILKHEFGTLMETSIAPMLPMIGDVTAKLTDMVKGFDTSLLEDAFASVGDVFKSLLPVIQTIGTAFMEIMAMIGPLISSAMERIAPLFERLLEAVLPLLDPLMQIGEIIINTILDAVEALMPVVEALAPILTDILGFVADALEKISPVIGKIIGQLADLVARILEKMEPHIEKLLDLAMQVIDAILPVLPEILDALMPILDIILELIDPILSIVTAIEQVYVAVMEKVIGVVSWVVDKLGTFIGWIADFGKALVDAFKAVWDAVVAVWHAVIDPLIDAIKLAWEALKGVLETIWNAIKSVFETVWDAIKSVFETTWNTIKTVAETVWNAIKGTAETVWNAIKTAIWTPIETVANALGGIWDSVKSAFGIAWEGIRKVADFIWGGIAGAIKGAINIAITAINGFIRGMNAVSGVIDWLIPGVEWGDIPTIPHVHTGGKVEGLNESLYALLGGEIIMNRNAVALAGEQNLINLNQGRAASLGGGNNILQVIYPQDDIDVDRALESLAWRLAG